MWKTGATKKIMKNTKMTRKLIFFSDLTNLFSILHTSQNHQHRDANSLATQKNSVTSVRINAGASTSTFNSTGNRSLWPSRASPQPDSQPPQLMTPPMSPTIPALSVVQSPDSPLDAVVTGHDGDQVIIFSFLLRSKISFLLRSKIKTKCKKFIVLKDENIEIERKRMYSNVTGKCINIQ